MRKREQSAQRFPLPISPEIQELASTYRLGAPIAAYRGGFTDRAITTINGIVSFIGVIGFIWVWECFIKRNPAFPPMGLGSLFGLATAVGSVVLWVISRPSLRRRRTWRVYVFNHGFVFTKEGQSDIFRWEEIRAIWHKIMHYRYGEFGYTVHTYIIERFDGYYIVLDDQIKKMKELGNLLSEQFAHAMWSRTLADYNAGNIITFGPLSVSQYGVSNGNEQLPWATIKKIKVSGEYVKIHQRGQWFSRSKVPIAGIPNLSLFLALTRFVLGK